MQSRAQPAHTARPGWRLTLLREEPHCVGRREGSHESAETRRGLRDGSSLGPVNAFRAFVFLWSDRPRPRRTRPTAARHFHAGLSTPARRVACGTVAARPMPGFQKPRYTALVEISATRVGADNGSTWVSRWQPSCRGKGPTSCSAGPPSAAWPWS
jgi:hypothetical protein